MMRGVSLFLNESSRIKLKYSEIYKDNKIFIFNFNFLINKLKRKIKNGGP